METGDTATGVTGMQQQSVESILQDNNVTVEQTQKALLNRNTDEIIKNIKNHKDVSKAMYNLGMTNELQKEGIEVVEEDEAVKILDVVKSGGFKYFDMFYAVLIETGNGSVADLLRPELAITRPDTTIETELPDEWPSAEHMAKPVNVRQSTPPELTQWRTKDVYRMRKPILGRCVIISNKSFYGPLRRNRKTGLQYCPLTVRQGTDKDEDGLKNLFEQLRFQVQLHQDKNKKEMEDILTSEACHSEQEAAECFVLIMCSHGSEEGLCGIDGKIIAYERISEIFNNQNCSGLAGKPKLMIYQACHGVQYDEGGRKIQTDTVTVGEDEERELKISQLELNEEERIITMPSNADTIIAWATHKGYVSFREPDLGSWFIQAIILVFQRYACNTDALGLLTLVNRLVSKGRTPMDSNAKKYMQASRFQSSCGKHLYFFPGQFEE